MTVINSPDFLVIGHICHDVIPGGFAPGGAANFAGLLAKRLGYRTAVLTSWGDDFQFAAQFEGLEIHSVPSPQTTVFENIYHDGQRIQYLHSRAATLSPADLPEAWHHAKTVMLGPICDEVSLGFLDFFANENTVTCVCPQGWMRQWDDQRLVSPKPAIDWQTVAKADVISMSIADVGGDWGLVEKIAGISRLLLVTQGAEGVTVFENGHRRHFPTHPAEELNPTGAGDVFAAAFLLRFSENRDVAASVDYAQQVAAAHVGKKDFI